MKAIRSMRLGVVCMLLAGGVVYGGQKFDAVAEGKKVFESLGCVVCHATAKDDVSAKTGPNLYGVFQSKLLQVSVKEETGEKKVAANHAYFVQSVRESGVQLAIAKSGPTQGSAYPPIMPAFGPNMISDADLELVWHYVRTLADPGQAGPARVMLERKSAVEVKSQREIPGEVVVAERVRVVRAPVEGMSGRALHVGLPNGMNYSFDPRLLGVRKVWSGGFLNMKGEQSGRGSQPSTLGHQASVLLDEGVLPVPLTASGESVDFEFKEPDVGDDEAVKKHLYDTVDFMDRLAALDAEYLGHIIDRVSGMPTFRFRVGRNVFAESVALDSDGGLVLTISGKLAERQRFRVGDGVMVEGGNLKDGIWTMEASAREEVYRLRMRVAGIITARLPAGGSENHEPQALVTAPLTAGKKPLQMPTGYSVRNWQPPVDLLGRKQLFEATGIALAKDGTLVFATRTSGIWRLRDGKWSLFADGIFESLGVCIEDDRGDRIVITQKPELSRLTDTDGDGRVDRFDTLCDDFGFHSNYHEYTHGPVRDAEGNYYFNLNLAHSDNAQASWRAGGQFMGSMGGYRGWSCRVTPSGVFEPFANGLRSPAGMGIAPDGRLWYAENQGEYCGSSKIVPLEQGKFYGHISGLVDLPGMLPDSEELKPELWEKKLRKGAVWLPHGKISASPGNPVWDLTGGRFGPYAGQMIVGDQTMSSLMRVVTEQVNGQDQGCAIPFVWGLSSGVMRPCFLPDGSLLLGQTGRGWGSAGGQVDSVQQVIWDGSTMPADILKVKSSSSGFDVHFTHPVKEGIAPEEIAAMLHVRSWFYRNNAAYGSPECDPRDHAVSGVEISADRRVIRVSMAGFGKEGPWLDRVHHIQVREAPGLFDVEGAWSKLEAYFTLQAIP